MGILLLLICAANVGDLSLWQIIVYYELCQLCQLYHHPVDLLVVIISTDSESTSASPCQHIVLIDVCMHVRWLGVCCPCLCLRGFVCL